MKKFENLVLLPVAAALSAFLALGCEKKNTDAAEPTQGTEEVHDEPAKPDHPQAEEDAAAAAGHGEHPGTAEEKADHPKSDHPKSDHPKSDHPK